MESIKMANDIVLETRGLVKKFGDAVILNGIDFTLHDKEVAVILGPSGCGKSTFLRCLIGLEPIQGGNILLKGKPLEFGSTLRNGIGMVFQSYDLFPHLTVLENILLAPLHVAKRSREDALAQAETLLERVKLWDKRDFYPRQLSGGQKQRTPARSSCVGGRTSLDRPCESRLCISIQQNRTNQGGLSIFLILGRRRL